MLMMVATHPFGASSRPVLTFVRAIPMPIEARCRRSAWFDAVTRLRVGRERREEQSRADADRYCPDHGSLLPASWFTTARSSRELTCANNDTDLSSTHPGSVAEGCDHAADKQSEQQAEQNLAADP